jgi:hypothetical protein
MGLPFIETTKPTSTWNPYLLPYDLPTSFILVLRFVCVVLSYQRVGIVPFVPQRMLEVSHMINNFLNGKCIPKKRKSVRVHKYGRRYANIDCFGYRLCITSNCLGINCNYRIDDGRVHREALEHKNKNQTRFSIPSYGLQQPSYTPLRASNRLKLKAPRYQS